METIQLNGKEYVLKEDYEQDIRLKNDKITELGSKPNSPLKTIYTLGLMDESNIMAIGSVQLGPEYKVVRITLDYVEKILNGINSMYDKKNKQVSRCIDIAVATDKPCVFGLRDKDKKSIDGFMLAPRIDND